MEFARRGRAATSPVDEDVDDGHRVLYPPPYGDPMLVIRDALLSQLQQDRLRHEIILAEVAKIERAMVLCNARHGIATAGVEWTKPVPFTFNDEFVPHRQWFFSPEHYADVDSIHDHKKRDGSRGSPELKSGMPAMGDCVSECLRPCYCNSNAGQENAKIVEQKLQEVNETVQPKKILPSAKWELTEVTIPFKKPPLKLSCGICQVQATSKHSLQEHCAGRKHRSSLATLESRNKAINQKAETTAEPSSCMELKTSSIQWNCSICQANGTSELDLKEHLNGRRHQQNIGAQCKEGSDMAKKLQETKRHESNAPQHAEKPPLVWSCSCSTCQANCCKSDSENLLLAKIQALLEQKKNMARSSESREAKLCPNTVTQHAEQPTSRCNCSICHANCHSELENHLVGKKHELNVQALHEDARQEESIPPHTAKNQPPLSERDCIICQAKCYSESQFDQHCRGRKHQKKIESLQAEDENPKSSGLKMDNKVPSDGSDNSSSTSEEQMTLYFCEVCNLQFSSKDMLADHFKEEKHLEKQKLLNFCGVCNLQCNSEKMLAHHHTGKKHQKRLSAMQLCLMAVNSEIVA